MLSRGGVPGTQQSVARPQVGVGDELAWGDRTAWAMNLPGAWKSRNNLQHGVGIVEQEKSGLA